MGFWGSSSKKAKEGLEVLKKGNKILVREWHQGQVADEQYYRPTDRALERRAEKEFKLRGSLDYDGTVIKKGDLKHFRDGIKGLLKAEAKGTGNKNYQNLPLKERMHPSAYEQLLYKEAVKQGLLPKGSKIVRQNPGKSDHVPLNKDGTERKSWW